MNEMSTSYRDYDNRDYRDYRDYREDYRNYRDDYREDYRDYDNRDYRDNYRDDYRDYRKRDYDRRGGKINYRNYRGGDYREELEMALEDMREQYRKLEDIAEMSSNPQEKNMLMRLAQKEKENYMSAKQMMEKLWKKYAVLK